MCLEFSDQNISRSLQSSTGDFPILYLAKRTSKKFDFSIFCRNKCQSPLPLHFCPYALSLFLPALLHVLFLFPPSPARMFMCIFSPEVAAAHAHGSQGIDGGTVSIATWKEQGASAFQPTCLWCVQAGWWRSSAPVLTLRVRQGSNCQLWSRRWCKTMSRRSPYRQLQVTSYGPTPGTLPLTSSWTLPVPARLDMSGKLGRESLNQEFILLFDNYWTFTIY